MDPYELFSTPPSDLVLSSTPNKPHRGRLNRRGLRAPNSARKAVLNEKSFTNSRASISFDSEHSFDRTWDKSLEKTKITKASRRQQQQQHDGSFINKSITSKNNKKKSSNRNRATAEAENLWDKCMKSNPELAQFVDNFNHSLEEATSKPLDMSGND